jgi:hypothetical protein
MEVPGGGPGLRHRTGRAGHRLRRHSRRPAPARPVCARARAREADRPARACSAAAPDRAAACARAARAPEANSAARIRPRRRPRTDRHRRIRRIARGARQLHAAYARRGRRTRRSPRHGLRHDRPGRRRDSHALRPGRRPLVVGDRGGRRCRDRGGSTPLVRPHAALPGPAIRSTTSHRPKAGR